MNIFADAAALLVAFGLLQCLVGMIAASRFAARRTSVPAQYPPITILRPLCGGEPLLDDALDSCCRQNYPSFQIVFGIQDPADPARNAVERLRARFPDRDITLVVNATAHGPNRKVGNLINMLPSARHELLVISDSDLHLPSNYLERLVAEIEKPGVGLVTAAYVGLPPAERGWPARMGATQISHNFLPGVLLSRMMGRQDCLGSTAMLRRETLEATGGLPALLHLLAEDNVLGQRVRALGLSIGLAETVPAATVPESSLRALWQHEIRWSRTIRAVSPLALGACAIQYPLFWAALAVALSGGALWSLFLFAGAWAVRAGSARKIDRALLPLAGCAALLTPIWLLPLRDILSVVEIAFSYGVDEVIWRGHTICANGLPGMPVSVLPSETLGA